MKQNSSVMKMVVLLVGIIMNVLLLFHPGSVSAQSSLETAKAENAPELMMYEYQSWIAEVLKSGELNLNAQVGSMSELSVRKDVSSDLTFPFKVEPSEEERYIRLDIYSKHSSDMTYSIIDTDDGRMWRTKAFDINMFKLPEGRYEICFDDVDNGLISFSLFTTEIPFAGKVTVLDPKSEYDIEMLKLYMKNGGIIFAYDNEKVLSDLNIGTTLVKYLNDKKSDQTYPSGITDVQVLDLSEYEGLYEPLHIYNDELAREDSYLSVFLPYSNGGILLISKTLMSNNKEDLQLYLEGISESVIKERSDFEELTSTINRFNGLFVSVIFVLGSFIIWALFGDQLQVFDKDREKRSIQENMIKLFSAQIDRFQKKHLNRTKFIRKIALIFSVSIIIVLFIIRLYQLRYLPNSILSILDWINGQFDLIGVQYLFSYVLLLILLSEFMLLIFLSKRFIENLSRLRFIKQGSQTFDRYFKKFEEISLVRNSAKALIVITFLAILISQFLRYFGIYPISYDYRVEYGDITSSNPKVVNQKLSDEFVSFSLKPRSNLKGVDLEVIADIRSSSEVYISVDGNSSLYTSPEFNMIFNGESNGLRTYTYDGRQIDLTGDINEALSGYNSLGIDRYSIQDTNLSSLKGFPSWGDFLVDQSKLSQIDISNDEIHEYEFSGLIGQFEFYTVVTGGQVDLEIQFTARNLDGNIPDMFVALVDMNDNLTYLGSVDNYSLAIGEQMEGIISIEDDSVEPGVVRIVVGYDPKEVLVDGITTEFDRKISIDKILINSNKLVFKPLSKKWATLKQQYLYVMRNENMIRTERLLEQGFNEYTNIYDEYLPGKEHTLNPMELSPQQSWVVYSFYSIYCTDEESYFYPFRLDITEIDKNNDIVISRDVMKLENISMLKPINISFFTSIGQRFILSQPIIVSVNKE